MKPQKYFFPRTALNVGLETAVFITAMPPISYGFILILLIYIYLLS